MVFIVTQLTTTQSLVQYNEGAWRDPTNKPNWSETHDEGHQTPLVTV